MQKEKNQPWAWLHIIDHDPYSTLLVMPRDDNAKAVSRTRIQPMIDAAACLRA